MENIPLSHDKNKIYFQYKLRGVITVKTQEPPTSYIVLLYLRDLTMLNSSVTSVQQQGSSNSRTCTTLSLYNPTMM